MDLDFVLAKIKRFIPKRVFSFFQPAYHWLLGFFGALFYGFPSRKMKVIGITGTKGKTTTCNILAQILNSAGRKTGMATTVNFRIGGKSWQNGSKKTMLGRFQLQKFLKQMLKEGCEYAVIETSSEGILQYRHRFIDYDAVAFTNLSPEHIERHGGFENYRAEKVKLFKKIHRKPSAVGIYNLDDANVEYFLEPEIKTKIGYTINNQLQAPNDKQLNEIVKIKNPEFLADKTMFEINGEKFETNFVGAFNLYNIAAAIAVSLSQNIPLAAVKTALKNLEAVPGRLEMLKCNDFSVIIDYAHEPLSLESIYKTAGSLKAKNSKLICLLGAQGGGRDKWKRTKMGEIAGNYCDEIVLTNEDPYDENPASIIEDIFAGIAQPINPAVGGAGNQRIAPIHKIIDRKKAIAKTLSLAQAGDMVVLTGKGGEAWMCVEKGKKIPWDERKIVEEIIS